MRSVVPTTRPSTLAGDTVVNTSGWSLAFRRDQVFTAPEVSVLSEALEAGETIVVTGLVLQELLQGFSGPKARKDIIDRFTALPLLAPDRLITSTPRSCAIAAAAPPRRLADRHDRRRDRAALPSSRPDVADKRQGFWPHRATLPTAVWKGGAQIIWLVVLQRSEHRNHIPLLDFLYACLKSATSHGASPSKADAHTGGTLGIFACATELATGEAPLLAPALGGPHAAAGYSANSPRRTT